MPTKCVAFILFCGHLRRDSVIFGAITVWSPTPMIVLITQIVVVGSPVLVGVENDCKWKTANRESFAGKWLTHHHLPSFLDHSDYAYFAAFAILSYFVSDHKAIGHSGLVVYLFAGHSSPMCKAWNFKLFSEAVRSIYDIVVFSNIDNTMVRSFNMILLNYLRHTYCKMQSYMLQSTFLLPVLCTPSMWGRLMKFVNARNNRYAGSELNGLMQNQYRKVTVLLIITKKRIIS